MKTEKIINKRDHAPKKTIVLVGIMGAGKSTVGKILADRLGMRFIDADQEIERAAGCQRRRLELEPTNPTTKK